MIQSEGLGFKSHSRYLEAEQTFCFFFFVAGVVCYLSPQTPFDFVFLLCTSA